MIIAGATVTSEASRQAVLKAIARARTWYEQLTTGKTGSIAKLAAKYGVTPTLYPNAHKAGSTEPARSIEKLMTRPESLPLSLAELLTNVPMNWNDQQLATPSILAKPKGPPLSITNKSAN